MGTTTITLVVNDGKVDSEPDTVKITIKVGLAADFSASPTKGVAPLRVHFTDESTGEIESWFWDFGDGKTSEEQNPTHTYRHAG